MNGNEIVLKIKSLYEECETLYQKIMSNKENINKYLSNFVVGSSIDNGVYSNDTSRGYDIMLSGKQEDYEQAIRMINDDINDIDLLISKHNEMKELMSQAPMDNEILEIGYKALDMIEQMIREREERISLLDRIKKTYQILQEQQEEFKKQESASANDIAPSGGVSGGSAGGVSGGVPAGSSGGVGGDASSGGVSQPTNNATTPAANISPATTFNANDYQQALSFQLTNDDIGVAKSNLATHAETTKGILSHVVVNGEVIGGDVYGIDGVSGTSDVGFNFGALQLACDAVNADVSAISAYITQMQNKITSNKAAIESAKSEMARTETVTCQDEKGNYYTEEKLVHSGAEIAAYQAQIDAMEAENKQLEADIVSYTDEKNKKQEVFNKLINFRNAYNNAYGGLMNTFAANDLVNALVQGGPDSNLLGMSLTDAQKQELFHNLGNTLMNNQNNLSLVTTEDFSLSTGQYPLGAYQYLLGCCSLLGNTGGTFQENYGAMQDFRSQIASSLGISLDGFGSSSSVEGGDNSSVTVDSDPFIFDIEGAVAAGRPASTKVLDPAIENFMLSHKGQISGITPEMKQALGLKMSGMISVPSNYNTTEEWPLLVWLAGTGAAGGSVDNLKNSVFVKNVVSGQYTIDGAIMYVPVGWGSGSSEANNSVYDGSNLNHDFQCVVNGLNVDKNHISGMGISIGGFALAYLVDANPDTFASAAMCGGGFSGPFRDVTVEKAIQNSPGTSFIWYNANNDETSGGVRTDAMNSHQALLNAGMNSVYYEVGGGIWHIEACDRFVTDAMVQDLISIEKGARYALPTGIQKVSAKDAYSASVSHGGRENNWYVSLSSGGKTGSVQTLEHRETTTNTIPKDKILPDLFVHTTGAIPDLSKFSIVSDTATASPSEVLMGASTLGDNSGTDARYLNGEFIVYSQLGNKNADGKFIWNGWDSLYYKKESNGEYTTKWGKDISTSGCSVASSAMVVSNLTHQNITPDYVKTLYHSPTANNGYGFAGDVFGKYGLQYKTGYSVRQKDASGAYYYDNVLQNGGAIINTVNEGGHYLAILGVDTSGGTKKYFVADPNTTSPGKWMDVNSVEFAPIKNGYHESSMIIAPPGMSIEQVISAPGTNTTSI